MKSETTHSRISEHGHGLGTVTEEMIRARAREIALTNGRREMDFNKNDLDQARTELLAMADEGPSTDETGENVGEWEELESEGGRRRTTKPAVDPQEAAVGINESGLEEALHEQMVEGNRTSREADEAT